MGDEESDHSVASSVQSRSSAPKSHFTALEKSTLIQLVSKYKAHVEDKSTTFMAKKSKDDAWLKITEEFCCSSGTSRRSAKQLKTWWNNSKMRAKKDISTQKRRVRQTGGGCEPPDLKHETKLLMAVVPSQMTSLTNEFDCDNDQENSKMETTQETRITPIENMSISASTQAIISKTNKKKERKDPRSSLVDKEYEEHRIRLRTLTIQLEDAEIQLEITKQRKTFEQKKQELELKALEQHFTSNATYVEVVE